MLRVEFMRVQDLCLQSLSLSWLHSLTVCFSALPFCFSPPARWGSPDLNKGATPSPSSSSASFSSSSPLPAPDAVGHAETGTPCRQPRMLWSAPGPEHTPERMPDRMPDRTADRIECQTNCQIECRNRCQIECQNERLKRCQDRMPERTSE